MYCWWLIWPIKNDAKNPEKWFEILTHEYSSNEYQHALGHRIGIIFEHFRGSWGAEVVYATQGIKWFQE